MLDPAADVEQLQVIGSTEQATMKKKTKSKKTAKPKRALKHMTAAQQKMVRSGQGAQTQTPRGMIDWRGAATRPLAD
jgi:hypothetical protein